MHNYLGVIMDKNSVEVNFKELSELAKTDPDAFEEKRLQLIQEHMKTVPEHKRAAMEQLQWRIDGIRRKSASPIENCIAIQKNIMELLQAQQQQWLSIQSLCKGANNISKPKTEDEVKNKLEKNAVSGDFVIKQVISIEHHRKAKKASYNQRRSSKSDKEF